MRFLDIIRVNKALGADMRPLKEKISITIDSDLLAKAKEAAEADDRSLSQFINIALKAFLASIEADDPEDKD